VRVFAGSVLDELDIIPVGLLLECKPEEAAAIIQVVIQLDYTVDPASLLHECKPKSTAIKFKGRHPELEKLVSEWPLGTYKRFKR
ncbi:hypothetical protein Tco_0322922, partial [Tanacetum coccineum]